jgi:hypothetical protein
VEVRKLSRKRGVVELLCVWRRFWDSLSDHLLVVHPRTRTAGRTASTVAEFANIDLQFVNGAAQSIAVHSQLPGSAALIALVLFENGSDETSLKLTYRFRIKNVAAIHVLHEGQ